MDQFNFGQDRAYGVLQIGLIFIVTLITSRMLRDKNSAIQDRIQ
ncbi:hypothetical protein [Breznakiella homolactica]|nr:hypothetical protein [Breznakiella homolactica]